MAVPKQIDYQALQQELEQLLDDLQVGQLSIEEALAAYERGLVIVKQLETYLTQAQNKVTKLKARFDNWYNWLKKSFN